ncbi:signal peptidase II [Proteinivorax hydrogeniformans]|uniref:Lipoprotein signal peptidase n=1 Tax=Proteinivorax hydrogeniformans TaxID=1826727 RepID=A0AAU8HPT0_9FIRM
MLYPVIIIIIIALDQISKLLAYNLMDISESIPLIENFLHITLWTNPGAAFGILPHQRLFFIVVTILVTVVLSYYIYKLPSEKWVLKLAFSLQIGGALGNLIDRIYLGEVIDFIDFKIWSPIFNVADIAIVVGVALFALDVLVFDMIQEKTGEG